MNSQSANGSERPTAEQLAVAFSLVSIIGSETTESAFAMFGAWGRGKTFTSETVRRNLPADMLAIRFPSWLYPNKPECWAHLYRTIFEGLLRENASSLYSAVVRMNFERSGVWQAVLSVMYVMIWLFAASSLDVGFAWSLAYSIGPVALLFAWKIASAVPNVVKHLHTVYWRIESHTEKLGLQETIGRDLRDLINAWNAPSTPSIRRMIALIPVLYIVPFAFLLVKALSKGTPLYTEFSGSVPPIMAWSVFCLCSLVLLVLVETNRPGKKRLLVIIEDLDRVSAEHSLSITESISVFLADHSASAAMHFLFLMDEKALDSAIVARHGDVVDRNVAYYFKERLFKAHIRLPPMTSAEAKATSSFIIEKDVLDKLLQVRANRQMEIEALTANLKSASKKFEDAQAMAIIQKVEEVVTPASTDEVEVAPPRRTGSMRHDMMMGEEAYLPQTKTVYKAAVKRVRKATSEEIAASKSNRDAAMRSASAEVQSAEKAVANLRVQLDEDEAAIVAFKKRLYHTDEGATKLQPIIRVGDAERQKIVEIMGRLSDEEGIIWGPRAIISFLRKFEMMMTLWHYLIIRSEDRALHDCEKSAILDAIFFELVHLLGNTPMINEVTPDATEEQRDDARRLARYVV